MTIQDIGDLLEIDLTLRRCPNQKERWIAGFKDSDTKETKQSRILCGTYGNGYNINEAIQNYVSKIRGRLLVINAASKDYRKELFMPQSLEDWREL